MQAIQSKYLSPTDTRPARIRATGGGQSYMIVYDTQRTPHDNHMMAAAMLARHMLAGVITHPVEMVTGCINDRTYVHVFTSPRWTNASKRIEPSKPAE